MANPKNDPSPERIRDLFSYRSDGVLIRRKLASKMSRTESVGDVVGGMSNGKYLAATVDLVPSKVHRLIYIWHFGSLEWLEIDHVNGDPSDNRIENLRAVTKKENLKNKKLYKNNASKVPGVSWHSRSEKWRAAISSEGKKRHIGYFSDWFEAVCARKSADNLHNYHINHGAR